MEIKYKCPVCKRKSLHSKWNKSSNDYYEGYARNIEDCVRGDYYFVCPICHNVVDGLRIREVK